MFHTIGARRHRGSEETLGFRAVDPRGASAYITVTVPICPRRIAIPQDPGSAIRAPDPQTGVVTGNCGSSCRGIHVRRQRFDQGHGGDQCGHGRLGLPPCAAARHEAVADNASTAERHDKFTITLSKGKRTKSLCPFRFRWCR
jgi:hypothetical protein